MNSNSMLVYYLVSSKSIIIDFPQNSLFTIELKYDSIKSSAFPPKGRLNTARDPSIRFNYSDQAFPMDSHLHIITKK